MILPALVDYYRRLKTNGVAIPQEGYADQKVHFAVVLEEDGTLHSIHDLREPNGKRLMPKVMSLPSIERSGSGFAPQFTWDNLQYVFGAVRPDQPKKKQERAPLAFEAFRESHLAWLDGIDDVPAVSAFCSFLRSWSPSHTSQLDAWKDICGEQGRISSFVFETRSLTCTTTPRSGRVGSVSNKTLSANQPKESALLMARQLRWQDYIR